MTAPSALRRRCLPWRGIDVGSPFDYGQQAILLRRPPPPAARAATGSVKAQLDEICELVDAAGRAARSGCSPRAARPRRAAEVVRERLPHLTTLAQGDAQLPELAKQFVGDPHTCLFGTLSLWQGLDVPGETCQLVLIDRIPFPRPDDPLMSARQRAADKAGGNGFMQVAATHAALLLAQGAGRLIRTTTDRGVVAVLDPRLVTARYGAFLRASLPPMWTTTDPALVRKALARLAGAAGSSTAAASATPRRRPRGPAADHVERPVVAGADDHDRGDGACVQPSGARARGCVARGCDPGRPTGPSRRASTGTRRAGWCSRPCPAGPRRRSPHQPSAGGELQHVDVPPMSRGGAVGSSR